IDQGAGAVLEPHFIIRHLSLFLDGFHELGPFRWIPIEVRDALSDHFLPAVTDKTFDRRTRLLDPALGVDPEIDVLDILEYLPVFGVALRFFSDVFGPL